MTKVIGIIWRFIRLGMSIWQIADMVSDGLQTKKYHDLSSVSWTIKFIETEVKIGINRNIL